MKTRQAGFQKPLIDPESSREVRVAVISYDDHGLASCSCGGWAYYHPREKVREDRIDKHIEKKHNGRGIRL